MAYKESTMEPGSLRDLLKKGTKDIHSVADNLFTDELVKKRISVKTYREFLSQLFFLYSAMEKGLEHNKDHPLVGPVHFPDELNRKDHIEQDLAYLYGDSWRSDIQCLPSTQSYVERIEQLTVEEPELLIAHAYVRYLGDVSGGQILKKIIKRMYNFPEDGSGIRFYDFQNVPEIPKFKEFYNARMNSLEVEEEGRQRLLDEAKVAFKHNIEIFQAIVSLAKSRPDGYMQDTDDSMRFLKGCKATANQTAQDGSQAKCPIHVDMTAPRKNAAMFVVTSASTIALVFALALNYCPWVFRS